MKSYTIWTFLAVSTIVSNLNAATIFRVDNYVSVTQSPFYEGIQNGLMYFNDFETSDRTYPNLTFPVPARYTSDVSIDKIIDPLFGNSSGHAMRTSGPGPGTFVLRFSPDGAGHYPRYFGMAFPTEVYAFNFPDGFQFTPQTESQRVGAFEIIGVTDAFGNAVLTNEVFDTPVDGEGVNAWVPDDPRWGTFFGIYNENGISQIRLYSTIYLDHLQYGYSIPEPSFGALTLGILGLAWRRRV